jgi:hypothetical protein
VLAMTSRHRGLLGKDCFDETPKPKRETRALPRHCSNQRAHRTLLAGWVADNYKLVAAAAHNQSGK